MRFIAFSILLLVLFSCAAVICAQHETDRENKTAQTDATMQERFLELTTSVADQRICANDSIQVILRLRYTNVGSRPIILFKYSSGISRVLVSRDIRSAAKRKYEYDAHQYLIATKVRLKPVDELDPNESLYVILKQGDYYEIETDVYFVGQLRTGDRVLQVKVWTWYDGSQAELTRLREKWQQFGYLWSKTVTSLPMPITIVKCQ